MDDFTEFYECWKGLPLARLHEIAERVIRDLEMPGILALRLVFLERFGQEVEESHRCAI